MKMQLWLFHELKGRPARIAGLEMLSTIFFIHGDGDGHLAMPVETSLRCHSWQTSC